MKLAGEKGHMYRIINGLLRKYNGDQKMKEGYL